jgi:hypothetical protein
MLGSNFRPLWIKIRLLGLYQTVIFFYGLARMCQITWENIKNPDSWSLLIVNLVLVALLIGFTILSLFLVFEVKLKTLLFVIKISIVCCLLQTFSLTLFFFRFDWLTGPSLTFYLSYYERFKLGILYGLTSNHLLLELTTEIYDLYLGINIIPLFVSFQLTHTKTLLQRVLNQSQNE